MNNILQEVIKIQERYPHIYLGGSISLILQNAIPNRIPKDVDLVTLYRLHIYEVFNVDKIKHPQIHFYKYNNTKFDLFVNPKAEYISYIYNGYTIKLSPIQEILDWKIKRLNEYNINSRIYQKHLKDLQND